MWARRKLEEMDPHSSPKLQARSQPDQSQPKLMISPQDRVFVLTGAGISAESGLATFRASDGLWSGHRVESVASPEGWEADPELVWNFYSQRRRDAAAALPNPAHLALAELEEKIGDRLFLCTQNVDDLHERAGSRNLVHMHGELFLSRCEDDCGRPVFADRNSYVGVENLPLCSCGARIRPHIVWFGEIPLEMDRIGEGTRIAAPFCWSWAPPGRCIRRRTLCSGPTSATAAGRCGYARTTWDQNRR